MKRALLALAALVLLAVPAHAQLAGGNLYGIVQDESGASLPGATVSVVGPGITQSFTAGSDGRFRFLNVPPGSYKITVNLTGFTTVVRDNVVMVVGASVDIPVALKVAQVEETITVTAESPVIDTKRTGTSTNFTQDELAKIPNSRDPWALLRTVPGMILDRVNIAGNESGQQSAYRAKGARGADGVWSMDGVNITDMAATGASPTYFDYDAFEEIQISTGGNDIRQPTGGVGVNFVTKRGTNSLHGTLRGYFTHDDLESSNVPDELAARGVTAATADHNRQIADYGLDLGGPIVKDKLWFWGSYGKQDIRLVRAAGNTIDKTLLKDFNVKVNWQATGSDMLSVMWFRGLKQKFGRAGASVGCGGCVEAPTALYNQDDYYPEDGPFGLALPGLWKIEDNHVFNANLFVTAKYAYYGTGFKLQSTGPSDQQGGESPRLARTYGSAQSNFFLRPQHTANLDGSYFTNAFGGNHEFKFGGGYRFTKSSSDNSFPGNAIIGRDVAVGNQRARIYRRGFGENTTSYVSVYLGDTFTKDRLTLNLGIRYDRQYGSASASSVTGNSAFPNAVPGITFAGYDAPFTWSDIQPRVGLTYAVDASRKTLLRASYARYAGQLAAGDVGYLNVAGGAGWAEYPWNDLNGDRFAQSNEVTITATPLTVGGGLNLANPGAVTSPNRFDPDYSAPLTNEVIAGLDREVARNLAVSISYSYRNYTRFLGLPRNDMTAADYAPGAAITGTLPNGQAYSVPTFTPNQAKVVAGGAGRTRTNRDGYSQSFHGFEFAATKRLADKWMLRLAAGYNNHRERFDGRPATQGGQLTGLDGDPLVNNGQYADISGGSGFGDVVLNSKWALNLNALYQLPWDLELAGNLFGKMGTPFTLYRIVALGQDGSARVVITPELDTTRFENLWNLDLRLAKHVKAGRTTFTLTADMFNVFNSNTEINRQRNRDSAAFNQLTQNLSPRIVRFGVRLGF